MSRTFDGEKIKHAQRVSRILLKTISNWTITPHRIRYSCEVVTIEDEQQATCDGARQLNKPYLTKCHSEAADTDFIAVAQK